MMRCCSLCGEAKPLEKFGGTRTQCYSCRRKRTYAVHKERMVNDVGYAARHKKLEAEKAKRLRKENPEKYRDRRRGRDNAKYRQKAKSDPKLAELIRRYNAEYRKRPHVAEKRKAAKKAWLASDNGKVLRRLLERARRKKARAGSNKATRAVSKHCLSLLELQKRRCAVCKVDLGAGKHLDHIVPLAAGGKHEIGNFQWLCPPCNLSKSAKNPIEFMQSRGFLL